MPEAPRDPMRAAQANMRAGRRSSASSSQANMGEAEGGGFALLLDGRRARTPAKKPLVVPTRAVAELIAAEWAGQGEAIDPAAMPLTRLANSAIDGVAGAMAATRAEIAGYAGADLLCYRAEAPEALVAAEAEAFDPVLDWAGRRSARKFGRAGRGPRPPAARARSGGPRRARGGREPLRPRRAACDDEPDRLGAARADWRARRLSAEEAWRIAHVGEDFQIARWGEDEEAKARRAARWRDFEAAAKALARDVAPREKATPQ